MIDISPAAQLRATLNRLKHTPQVGPVLRELDAYVASLEQRLQTIEARLQGLDRMPHPAALDRLTAAAHP